VIVIALPQHKTWEFKRARRALTVSPTQIESKRRCRRQWWFSHVRRLPQPPGKPQVFGTVLHAVAERYLKADDLGRDENGDPVDLYPDDWQKALNRFDGKPEGEISEAEQAQVKKLITAAIESGVLERRSDRGVERSFSESILSMEEVGTAVTIVGFIDLEHVGEIQDHKTTSAMKWAKSPAALRENVQMLIYAKQHIEFLKERGAAVPAEINLRHNYYCKDWKKPEVRKVEVQVSVAQIEAEWKRVLEDAREMVVLRDTIEDGLSEIPDPDMTHDNPCMAYGGCAYRRICSRTETLETYLNRLDSYSKGGYIDPQAQTDKPAMYATRTKDQSMSSTSFEAKLAAKRNKKGAAAPAAPTLMPPRLEPKTAGPSEGPSSVDEAVLGSPPPWTHEGCPACKGCGFNTKGNPCAICQHKTGISVNLYKLIPNDDGTVTWIEEADTDNNGVSPLPGQQAPVKVSETAPPLPEPEPEPAAPESEAEEEKPKRKRGRPRKAVEVREVRAPMGFTLLINCNPIGYNGEVLPLSAFLNFLGKQMAEENNSESFYDLNVFDRRDALKKAAPKFVAELEGKMVVAEGIGLGESDTKALTDALRPFANMVIAPHTG